MESNPNSKPTTTPKPPALKKRFQIVKLEERIAPRGGGNSHGNGCNGTNHGCGSVATFDTCSGSIF